MDADRPLRQLKVDDLEELFSKQKQDNDVLADLNAELAKRKGKRALALRGRVLKSLKLLEKKGDSNRKGEKTDTAGESKLSGYNLQPLVVQPDLWSAPPQNKVARVSNTADTTSFAALPGKETDKPFPEMPPQLSVEDACLVLKVTVGDSWEKVEGARRKIVVKSSPVATKGMRPAKIKKLLADAQQANCAAIVIATGSEVVQARK